MEEQMNNEQQEQPKPKGTFIRMKPFALLMLVFFTIVATAGLTIFALTFGESKAIDVQPQGERAAFTKLYEAYDELKARYYKDVDDEALVNGAIDGMFDALEDPYSEYMDKEKATSFNEGLSSSFQGIGAEIQERNGYIMVVAPIKNSPAEKAGILARDLILAVDGESIQGMSANEAVLLIRGEKGTEVKLMVQRGETDTMEFTIVRDEIPIETVYGDMGDDKIAHLQITSFSEDTFKEVAALLTEYEEDGMKGIILDVRQNPGGYLNAAIEISNLFVPEGETIVSVQEKDKEPIAYEAQGGKKYTLPLTVLIDEGSASASEILAGALSETVEAEVIGLTSFGKGTVQTVSYLDDGGNLKYTTGKWLTPDGNWINEKGIAPTIEVPYPDYATLNYLSPTVELKQGTTEANVETAEKMLDVLGFDPGTIDTTFDEATTAAVQSFQRKQGLDVTGIVTGDTTYALIDAIREKLQTEDPQILKAKEVLRAQ